MLEKHNYFWRHMIYPLISSVIQCILVVIRVLLESAKVIEISLDIHLKTSQYFFGDNYNVFLGPLGLTDVNKNILLNIFSVPDLTVPL